MTIAKTLKLDETLGEREANVASLGLTPDLLHEPPIEQVEFVCTVQFLADRGSGRRRFDFINSLVWEFLLLSITFLQLHSRPFAN